MRKIILILLVLCLCGCSVQESGLIFPEVTYADSPMVTLPPQAVLMPEVDIPSKIESLKVMDQGFEADAIACLDNTMLAADINGSDYQLVHIRLAKNADTFLPIERKVIKEDKIEQYADEQRICDVFADSDYYYVLLGEMPPCYIRFDGEEVLVLENKDFAGRFRVLKYDSEGILIDTLQLGSLPINSAKKMLVLENGNIFILGMSNSGEHEGALNAVLDVEICLLIDGDNGEIISESTREDRSIYSLSTDGQRILAYFDTFSPLEAGFAWIDPESGEETMLDVQWQWGVFEWPYCVQAKYGFIMLNNQVSFAYMTESEINPLLNSSPDDKSPLKKLEETSVCPVKSCYQYDDGIYIVSLDGSEDVWVFSAK